MLFLIHPARLYDCERAPRASCAAASSGARPCARVLSCSRWLPASCSRRWTMRTRAGAKASEACSGAAAPPAIRPPPVPAPAARTPIGAAKTGLRLRLRSAVATSAFMSTAPSAIVLQPSTIAITTVLNHRLRQQPRPSPRRPRLPLLWPHRHSRQRQRRPPRRPARGRAQEIPRSQLVGSMSAAGLRV